MYKKKKIITLSLPCFIEYVVFFYIFPTFITYVLYYHILYYMDILQLFIFWRYRYKNYLISEKNVSIDNNYFISTKFFLIFYIIYIYICTKKKITKNHSKLIFRLDIWDNNCILYLRKLFISLEISNCTYQLVNDLWRGSLCVISFS